MNHPYYLSMVTRSRHREDIAHAERHRLMRQYGVLPPRRMPVRQLAQVIGRLLFGVQPLNRAPLWSPPARRQPADGV